MRVARLIEVGKRFEAGTAKKPTPGPKDVLVKVEACGIVPNTYNIVSGKATGFTLPELPCVFGLDVGGTIEATGSQVFNLKAGDRVYVNPYLTCGTCYQCRRERKDHCENGALRGYFAFGEGGSKMLSHYPVGGFSEYVLSPDANIAVLPSNIDTKTAARFGYMGTSFGGLKKADVGPGKSLLINGVTGTLGYAAVAIALGLGCVKVLGIGRNKERLAEVGSLSKLGLVSVRSSEDEGDIIEWIKKETGGIGVDAMYDCLGVGGDAEMTSKYIGSVRPGGKVVLAAGGADGKISQDYADAMMRDTAILGTLWFSDAEIDEMIRLIGAGVIDLSFLQHKLFSLEQVNEALEFVGDRPGGAINVVVRP